MVKCEDKRQSYKLNTKRALGWHQQGVEGTGQAEALMVEHRDAALVEDLHHHHLPHGILADQVCCWHRHCRREQCCWRAVLTEVTKERMTLGRLYKKDVLSRNRTDSSSTRQFPRQCWNHMSLPTSALSNTFCTF